jgi:hypothetical protein
MISRLKRRLSVGLTNGIGLDAEEQDEPHDFEPHPQTDQPKRRLAPIDIETDDMRDAPAIPIIARLIQDGAVVYGCLILRGCTKQSLCCLPRSFIVVMQSMPQPIQTPLY